MLLTPKEVNELNADNLTPVQVRILYEKHGFIAVVSAGKIVKFVHKNENPPNRD